MNHTDTKLISVLYGRVISAEGVLRDLKDAWIREFRFIHGEVDEKRKIDRRSLQNKYELPDDSELDIECLVFVLEALIAIKMMLRIVIALSQFIPNAPDPSRLGITALIAHLKHLASGDLTSEWGIGGFSIGPTLTWTLDEMHAFPDEMLSLIKRAHLDVEKSLAQPPMDIMRADYHHHIPKELRHALGAYYTPTWLAEHALLASGWSYNSIISGQKMIDPACGSGAFFVAAAALLWDAASTGEISGAVAAEAMIRNVHGIDLSALAVLGAQCNLLLSVAALRVLDSEPHCDPFSIYVKQGNGLTLESEDFPKSGFEYVVGNPPWVNWEYLPIDYRTEIAPLWPSLGLFELGGRDRAFSKEDISGLFVYSAADRLLKDGGMLSFLIPQSLFQSALNGRKFREFSIRDKIPLGVIRVEDFVEVKPFEGVSNRTSLLVLRKGVKTTYPVPYIRWSKSRRGSVAETDRLQNALQQLSPTTEAGSPLDQSLGAAWIIGPTASLEVVQVITGKNFYRARTGIFTGGANGVYHLRVLERLENGNLLVSNIVDRTKRKVPEVTAEIEPDYVFPLVRGREISRWASEASDFILCPHTSFTKMLPVPEPEMSISAPLTLAYLKGFKSELAERRGFAGWERGNLETGFYAIQRIGEYTFAPYKLVWRYIASKFICAVLSTREGKPQLPNEKLMLIAFESEAEAHFVCSVLTSSPARWFVESRMVSTQIAPHVIEKLALPMYDPRDGLHRALSQLSLDQHDLPRDRYEELDEMAGTLFGLTPGQVRSTVEALRGR
jgi:hypothetical protein